MLFCMLSTENLSQGVYVHVISAFLLYSNNMLMLVVSLVVLLFVPIHAGKTNNISGIYMYMYVATLTSRSLNGGEMAWRMYLVVGHDGCQYCTHAQYHNVETHHGPS